MAAGCFVLILIFTTELRKNYAVNKSQLTLKCRVAE